MVVLYRVTTSSDHFKWCLSSGLVQLSQYLLPEAHHSSGVNHQFTCFYNVTRGLTNWQKHWRMDMTYQTQPPVLGFQRSYWNLQTCKLNKPTFTFILKLNRLVYFLNWPYLCILKVNLSMYLYINWTQHIFLTVLDIVHVV